MGPLVSICVPTYNNGYDIEESLDALVRQTYRNLEIVVCDDGSTDNTRAVVSTFRNSGVVYHRNLEHIGRVATMNRCLELARGACIAFYHADYLYDPTIVEKEVAFLIENPQAGAVLCLGGEMDDERLGHHPHDRLPPEWARGGCFDLLPFFVALLRHKQRFLHFASLMVRAAAITGLGLFNHTDFGSAADLDMCLRILARYQVGLLPEALMSARRASRQQAAIADYLRCERDKYFAVMDHYLTVGALRSQVGKSALTQYQAHQIVDATYCAVNQFIIGENRAALALLRASRALQVFLAGPRELSRPTWLLRTLLWFAIHAGARQLLGRPIYALQYGKSRAALVRPPAQSVSKPPSSTRRDDVVLFIDPFYHHLYGDLLFDPTFRMARFSNSHQPFVYLRNFLLAKGIRVHTADFLLREEIVGKTNIYCSFGMRNNYKQIAQRDDTILSAFFLWEGVGIDPSMYQEVGELSQYFKRIFSWSDAESLKPFIGVDVKLHTFRYIQDYDDVLAELWERRERRFLTLIAKNKKATLAQDELYSERVRAVEFFSQTGEIDLYGVGWDEWPLFRQRARRRTIARVYKGPTPSRHETLSRYKFAICYDNMRFPGWVTEKIFDALAVGTVPIYLGAPDIENYVPAHCFIDKRRFPDCEELRFFLHSLSEQDLDTYRQNARQYFASDMYKPFRKEFFADLMLRIIAEDLGKTLD